MFPVLVKKQVVIRMSVILADPCVFVEYQFEMLRDLYPRDHRFELCLLFKEILLHIHKDYLP